jgi:hypothetical protein
MADISITVANVVQGTGAKVVEGVAGAGITAGQVLYLDSATNTYKLADCNSATAAARSPAGIALHGALTGQPVAVQLGTSGSITIGGTLTAGVVYYLSGTPGGIRPVADNTTGDYPVALGIATSTTVLKLGFLEAGVAL